jgi:excisionase family DNA binding protein
MSQRLLDVGETAVRLGCTKKTLRDWIRSGRMPFVLRLGRRYRIPEERLNEWVERQAVGASQD